MVCIKLFKECIPKRVPCSFVNLSNIRIMAFRNTTHDTYNLIPGSIPIPWSHTCCALWLLQWLVNMHWQTARRTWAIKESLCRKFNRTNAETCPRKLELKTQIGNSNQDHQLIWQSPTLSPAQNDIHVVCIIHSPL